MEMPYGKLQLKTQGTQATSSGITTTPTFLSPRTRSSFVAAIATSVPVPVSSRSATLSAVPTSAFPSVRWSWPHFKISLHLKFLFSAEIGIRDDLKYGN